MSFNDNLVSLKALRDSYFSEQISYDQYRATRNRLLDDLSAQVNGRQRAAPESQIPQIVSDWEDQNPFN